MLHETPTERPETRTLRLEHLHDEQREAVTHGEGPHLIVAGAGTREDAGHHPAHRLAHLREARPARADPRPHVHRLEMGGMFRVVKVRDNVKPGDYKDPGWYKHPKGTVAYEWQGAAPEVKRAKAPKADDRTMQVKKPGGHSGHAGH